jgi:flagellum-specific peptidoglycan hydrolase FlgJ
MGEDENLQKGMKKQEEQDASKKALKTGAKAAANAYLGPVGGKAVDLASKTKLGDNILNKGAESINKKAPKIGKIANAANKSGALDAADKAVDATSGGVDSLGKDTLGNSNNALQGNSNLNMSKSNFSPFGRKNSTQSTENFDQIDSSFDNDYSSKIFKFIKGHWTKIIPIIGGFFLLLMLLIVIIVVTLGPVTGVLNFFSGIKDTIVGFFSQDEEDLMDDYYNKLEETQTDIRNNLGLCVDVNLITAALTVNIKAEDFLNNGEKIDTDEINNDNYNSDDPNSEASISVDYKRMKKQIKLLANMQIMTNRYEKSSECADNESTTLITEGDKDSSTKELIASHDDDSIFEFFKKKSNKEKNYVYYKYTPAYEITKVGDTEIKTCPSNAKAPEDTKEISIGDLSTMEDSVFYWNLVNSFIPDYYADYLPESEPKKTEAIKKIAEDIYLLYQDMGPSQSCSMDYNFICRSDEGSNYYSGTTGNATASRTEFMNNISPVAISEMTRTGVYASVTMAQAALESANGGSGLSTKYANYYGMTAGTCAPKAAPSGVSGTVYRSGEGGNTCSGNSFWDGTVVAMCNSSGKDCQWYRVYDSFENSTRDHSRLLSDKYNCNVYGSNSEQLQCIKDHGYATDPNYVSKILNVIKTYNLSQYDIGTWDGTTTSYDSPTYNNKICYNGGSTNSGTFTSWKQYDSQWSNVRLGNKTVGAIGCAMTSVAIQIMRSGSPLSIEEFNPGTFAQALTKAGGFDAAGNITWSAVERIAPNFKFVDRINHRPSLQELNNLVSQGYYVILNVKYGRHWIAIDSVDVANNKIYMFDPGSPGTEVGETYGLNSIQRYVYYRRV